MTAASGPSNPSPISPRRLAANRANATQSTGPRTAAGKTRSARNAGWHGLGRRDGVVALTGAERARMGRLRARWAGADDSEEERECLKRAARAGVIVERLARIDSMAFAEARMQAEARALASGADEDATALAVAAALPDLRTLTMLARQTERWSRALIGAFGERDRLRTARRRGAEVAHEPKPTASEVAGRSGVAADQVAIRAHAVEEIEPASSAGRPDLGGRVEYETLPSDRGESAKLGNRSDTRSCPSGGPGVRGASFTHEPKGEKTKVVPMSGVAKDGPAIEAHEARRDRDVPRHPPIGTRGERPGPRNARTKPPKRRLKYHRR